jgi:hypothetical protein
MAPRPAHNNAREGEAAAMSACFTPPFTPSGRSSLVPPPPWRYAGKALSLAFDVDQTAAQSLLPDGFGAATGKAYGHFCDWQADTPDGDELLDPAYSQYKEFFVLAEAVRPDGATALYCPFIYVDQDVSMARGWLQGWPKKLGSIWITRSYGVDHPAAAPLRAGTKMGATLAVKDRRLAEAAVTLTGSAGAPVGFLAEPTLGRLSRPTLIGGADPGFEGYVRMVLSEKIIGPFHEVTGSLRFFDSPRDELSLLAPLGPVTGAVGDFAMTLAGVERV